MHMFIIVLLLFGCSTLTNSRPSRLQEENDSEMGGNEYESDETVDDEYVPEEGQAAEDEVAQKDSENQELIDARRLPDKNFNNNGEAFQKFTDTEMRDKKVLDENNPNDVRFRAERFSFAKEHPNYIFGTNSAAEPGGLQSSRNDYPRHRAECRNSEHLADDNSGDLLFKRFHDHMKKDKNDIIEDVNEQSNLKRRYDRTFENKAVKDYDYVYSPDRNRRQVQNVEEKPVTVLNNIKNENNNLDVVNESAILRNIKKLSEQDLEELMNSLPEDKKVLLKKIMDKREITKKAGAMEDSLDQSDTSKIEGSYSVNTNSVSSLLSNSDTTETNKNIESGGGINTKVSDNEGESGKSESKSGDVGDTSTTKELLEITDTSSKDESNINSENNESFKSENKREINRNYLTNENTPLDNSIISDNKNLNELPVQEDNSENEDWLETKNEDLIAEQGEVSQGDSSDLTAAVEKLEESFPSANADGDTESYLEPLIRIKRKELQHKVKKRDLPFMANEKVSFISDSEINRSDEDEGNEFNYKESLNSQSDFLKNVVEHNLTRNKILRNKRDSSSDDIFNATFNNTLKLNKSNHILASLHNEDSLVPHFSVDKSQYKGDETGSFLQNSEDNLNRHKRIRRVKN